MKINELMIDDLVEVVSYDYLKYAHVVEIYETSVLVEDINKNWEPEEIDIADIKPVLLTQEILEKNFPEDDILAWWNTYNNKFHIEITDYLEYNELGQEVRLDIAYVHKLQHALKLCEIYKEIEL